MNTQANYRNIVLVIVCALLLSWTPLAVAQQAGGEKSAGKVVLFDGRSLDGWKLRNEEHKDTWKVVSQVALDKADPKQLVGTGSGGAADAVLFRARVEHGSDILTERSFGDCKLHIEVMVPKDSNSGVYLMGQYEVQVFDSFGKPDDKIAFSDMGGIYSVKAPAGNVSKAPGEWQTLDVEFRAPRFDAAGKKTESAKFLKVTLNGKVIQENVEVPGPTGGQLPEGEKATGPLMLQGDHGVVAYRNITIEPAK
ncbi:MAG TPA: DUF1080 domain-containing protein [Phycisphaerae bacterium]|nr:DUF1080 domain-containing protein [Phycisphaerae bacterium]HNU44264.1 DUF1080 domain-containing protein [Phycisphaerae bacterium]